MSSAKPTKAQADYIRKLYNQERGGHVYGCARMRERIEAAGWIETRWPEGSRFAICVVTEAGKRAAGII